MPSGQFRAGFSEQFIILARKDEPTPDYVPEFPVKDPKEEDAEVAARRIQIRVTGSRGQ